jgi:ribosomal protein S18 acetylase RimI-like enzyme
MTVRVAKPADAEAIGRLLHDFNSEFGDPTPGPAKLAERVRELIAAGEITTLVADAGVAVMYFRPSLWTEAHECYLAELYVVPGRRGEGHGRALLDAAIELARENGADYMCLATSEGDVAARALYESSGFSHREGDPEGPAMYYYEREL